MNDLKKELQSVIPTKELVEKYNKIWESKNEYVIRERSISNFKSLSKIYNYERIKMSKVR